MVGVVRRIKSRPAACAGSHSSELCSGWHVDHDQAVDARRFGFGDKPRYAVVVNRVEVTHQHQRGVAVAFTEFANHLQGIRQILPGRQRTDIGQLNRRTIRHRGQ